MKDFFIDKKNNKLNIKKIIILVIICIFLIAIVTTFIIYNTNQDIQKWIDVYVLNKELRQDNVTSIELEEENSKVCAFNQYIGVLSKNSFTIYNSNGNQENKLTMEITTPIFDSNNRFLAVAEKNGKKVYLISNKEISWEKQIDGDISQIMVNKNGYVAITVVNTSYKTVIEMYNPQGEEMFKTYLSTTRTADVDISNDNKYLAIAEIDTSGTKIQSSAKIISVKKAQTDPTNSVEKIYASEAGKLITNLKYQDNNKLISMFTDGIDIIEDGNESNLTNSTNKKITFSTIDLQNSVATVEEKSSGLFTADSVLKFINIKSKEEKEYITNEVTKEIYSKDDILALNLGSEVDFVNTSGWLVKKYISNQEITSMILSNSIAGIVFRNRIEIIKF